MAGNGPKYRITIAMKDKSDITFTDYKGVSQTKRYAPIGVVFEKDDGRLSVKIERAVRLDPATMWVNLDVAQTREEREHGQAREPAGTKPQGDPFGDDDIPS